jgi:hypothetical protein
MTTLPLPDSASASAEDDETKPTVYRAGKLPKDIPAWFEQLDTDKDGQIGLYEWVNGNRSIDEFRAMDRNEDGFLTIDEVMAYVRANKGGSLGDSAVASNSMNGFNVNGFNGFGGGPMQFGDMSQDNRGRPGRNRGPGMGSPRGPNGGNGGNRPDGNWFKGRGGDNNGGYGGGPPGRGRGGDNNGFGGGPGRPSDNANIRPAGGAGPAPAYDNSGKPGGGRNNRSNSRNQDGQ